MAETKPIGPGTLYVNDESPAFTWTEFAATDALRHLEFKLGFSERKTEKVQESRPDRGSYARTRGDYEPAPWSIAVRLWGAAAAGTALAAMKALYESAAGWSETVVGGTSVTYECDAANPTSTVSMYFVDRDTTIGRYAEGCICEQIVFDIPKEGTGMPKVTFSGQAARTYDFMSTTIGAIDDSATSATLGDTKKLRSGCVDASESGLPIIAKIENEIIKITAYNWTTGVATIARAQYSTSAAAHDASTAITPYNETPTFGETAGTEVGSQDWTLSDGSAVNARAIQITHATGRKFCDLQSGSSSRDDTYSGEPSTTGKIDFILDSDRYEYGVDMDQETELDLAIVLGTTAATTRIHTLNLDKCVITKGPPTDVSFGEPVMSSIEFECRDTQTAMGGQIQLVQT